MLGPGCIGCKATCFFSMAQSAFVSVKWSMLYVYAASTCNKLGCVIGPTVADASKINNKTVEAHKALQGGLVNLGQALAEGQSPAQLRELAASRGLHVQDPLRVSPLA